MEGKAPRSVIIVTVEEIVDDLEAAPNACILPRFTVGAVCLEPHGAWPSYAQGFYKRDNAFYKAWDDISRDRETAGSASDFELTPRELDVLALLAEGASNKMIARRLGISVHTAKFHVGSLLDKLDATGRTDAVAHAARRGVINL